MREITSVELHAVIEELSPKIVNGFLKKFYDLGGGAFRLGFYKDGRKTMVYCKLLSTFNETSFTESAGEPSQFAMGMRKRIEGCRLLKLDQHGSDRLITLLFDSKEGEYTLAIEMFGKGNVVLVNGKGIIEQCYLSISFRDREIKPRAQYRFPKSQAIDVWNAEKGQVLKAVNGIKGMPRAMPELSKAINMGPLYLENIFNETGIDPKGRISSDEEAEKLAGAIARFIAGIETPRPRIYRHGGELLDYALVPIKKYEAMMPEVTEYGSASAMLDALHSEERSATEPEADAGRTAELNANIKKQEELAVEMEKDAKEYQKTGERIFERMHEINALIDYLQQNRRATLEEVRSMFMNLRIKELDLKNKSVKIEVIGQ